MTDGTRTERSIWQTQEGDWEEALTKFRTSQAEESLALANKEASIENRAMSLAEGQTLHLPMLTSTQISDCFVSQHSNPRLLLQSEALVMLTAYVLFCMKCKCRGHVTCPLDRSLHCRRSAACY